MRNSRIARLVVQGLLPLIAAFSVLSSTNAQDYEKNYESLDSIAARSPTEQVELIVKFKLIQREPAIVEILQDSSLNLDSLRFKFAGSGGGGVGAGDLFGNGRRKSVEELFDEAELEHRLFFQTMVSGGEEIPVADCPVDDSTAAVVDTHGKPGEAAVELACGVRVVEMRLSGPARAALTFKYEYGDIAEIQRWPSTEERQRVLQSLQRTQ